jgi:hypothetical protein
LLLGRCLWTRRPGGAMEHWAPEACCPTGPACVHVDLGSLEHYTYYLCGATHRGPGAMVKVHNGDEPRRGHDAARL